MVKLVKTSRKLDFTGVTPAVLVVGTLFFSAILAGHFIGKYFQTDLVPCPFKIATGLPCFLCGGTRAALNLTTGHPILALQFNPLVTIILGFVSVALLLKIALAKKVILSGPFQDRRFLWMLAITVVGANWIYVIRTL
ncbi:MAG: DUF2752 domain-containing protein [Verrucomicrobiales bacterium]